MTHTAEQALKFSRPGDGEELFAAHLRTLQPAHTDGAKLALAEGIAAYAAFYARLRRFDDAFAASHDALKLRQQAPFLNQAVSQRPFRRPVLGCTSTELSDRRLTSKRSSRSIIL